MVAVRLALMVAVRKGSRTLVTSGVLGLDENGVVERLGRLDGGDMDAPEDDAVRIMRDMAENALWPPLLDIGMDMAVALGTEI